MKKIIPLLLIFCLLTGCLGAKKTPPKDVIPPTPAPVMEEIKAPEEVPEKGNMIPAKNTDTVKSFTAAEVAEHKNGQSCWLILENKVYDVTSYIGNHPGGESILRGCGKDATEMFARHPESAKAMKEQFFIGELKG